MDTEKKFPDYAEMQRLHNIYWADGLGVGAERIKRMGTAYHQLAVKYGEDVLIEALEQFYTGAAW